MWLTCVLFSLSNLSVGRYLEGTDPQKAYNLHNEEAEVGYDYIGHNFVSKSYCLVA